MESTTARTTGDNIDCSDISVVSNTGQTEGLVNHGRRQINWDNWLLLVKSRIQPGKTLHSPEVNMMRFYQTFLNLYMPKVFSLVALQSFFTAAPSSPALSFALKSVSLLLVYRESKDPRMLRAAIPEYSNALREARKELCRPKRNINVVVGMAHMLSLCEIFNSLSLSENSAGTLHAHWLTTFIEGLRTEEPDPEIRLLLTSGVRWLGTLGCLLARKGVPGFTPRLQEQTDEAMSDMTILSGDLMLATSAAIEASDKLCVQSRPSTVNILKIFNETIWLEEEVHSWLTRYCKIVPNNRIPFWTVSLSSNCAGERGSPFRYVYEFVNLQIASAHLTCWMCLLVLTESRASILEAFFHKLPNGLEKLHSDLYRLKKASSGYADSICMSLPILSRRENGWAGRVVAIRALNLLVSHFKRKCDWQKLAWCVRHAPGSSNCASQSCSLHRTVEPLKQ